MPALPIERELKDLILELIKTDPKSISGITRELKDQGQIFHKLVVTGYLKALTDMGYLRERDLPPSKIYYKSIPHKKDIYESLGEKVSELDLSKRNQIILAIDILGRLFNRPVFRHELIRCGFTGDIDAPSADPETVTQARKFLSKAGVKIPKNEPAFESRMAYDHEFQKIVLDIFREQFGIKKFAYDKTQVKLDTD
jgi:hypothetical protein